MKCLKVAVNKYSKRNIKRERESERVRGRAWEMVSTFFFIANIKVFMLLKQKKENLRDDDDDKMPKAC